MIVSNTSPAELRDSSESGNGPGVAVRAGAFDWPLAHKAEDLLRGYMGRFLERNRFARGLAERMSQETGTDFFEWIDHFVLNPADKQALTGCGFVCDAKAETPNGESVYE